MNEVIVYWLLRILKNERGDIWLVVWFWKMKEVYNMWLLVMILKKLKK